MPVLTAFVLLLSILLTGCQAVRVEAPRPTGGEVLVYFQPLPPGAVRLRFSLAAVAMVREDGSVHPLTLHLPHPTDHPGDQQPLASGKIPEGAYSGVLLTLKQASIKTEAGEAALLLTERDVIAPVAFALRSSDAVYLQVGYRHAGSIRQQFEFTPSFFVQMPEPPIVGRMAFANNPDVGRLTIFDRKTLQVTGALALGTGSMAMAIDERRRRLYVALSDQDAVAIIDVASGHLVGRIPLQTGDRPEHLALNTDGRLLLCTNTDSDTVSFLDPHSQVELARVSVADEPGAIVIERHGRRAFVFNSGGNSITVLDLLRHQLITTLTTDPGPFRGAFNRDGNRLFVIHRHTPYLTVVDTTTLAVRERLPIGAGASAILLDSRTGLLYLGRADLPRIDIFDPFSLQSIDFLALPEPVTDLAIDDEENRLLLAFPATGEVAAVDLVGKRIVGRVKAGKVHSLALMGGRR